MTDTEYVRIALKMKVAQAGNCSQLARLLEVNRTTLWRFLYDNYEPKRQDIRRKLGLPERIVMDRYRGERGRFK